MIEYGRIGITFAASVLASAAAAAGSPDFRARGNEPSWSIYKTDEGITFRLMDGKTVTISPLPVVQKTDGVEIYQSKTENQPFTLTITSKICVDSMSGMPYPASVVVEVAAEKFTGCGGEPETLLQGEWAVKQIDGNPVADASQVTLNFDANRQLSGNASCNRYFGPFVLTGEGLTISNLGSSRMMCAQPLMDQEALFLRILGEVSRFEIGPDGSLILHAKDGRSVAASRKG
jgi:heat shock protein HslJ